MVLCMPEKCGQEEERLCFERPFQVDATFERVIRMTVNPQSMQISTCELPAERMDFEGSTAFALAHETKHLEATEIRGTDLREFRFVE
ncbi:MAG: hypothetical protein QCH35_05990 [Methanomicrobiaceae archaeon]|nr:hypothetical protein [Methanomicrobiaceae archaeon]